MAKKTVCVVGGGISGLVCAQTLTSLSKSYNRPLRVILLEASQRLGGQIMTENHSVRNTHVTIEAGAEGFVTRSKVFPEVARLAGVPQDQLVNQIRIADNELRWDADSKRWNIEPLEPGIAAQKLGFQVPKQDRGKGIRSFHNGMSALVNAIGENLSDVRVGSSVRCIDISDSPYEIETSSKNGSTTITSDAVVLATPLESIRTILNQTGLDCDLSPLVHHSHVSVHLLVPVMDHFELPKSFTVPAELQHSLNGLRAVSFVNEKFPDRCEDGYWLFRFYFRPSSESLAREDVHWRSAAERILSEVYGIGNVMWTSYSPWVSQLPTISQGYLEDCRTFKEMVASRTNNRIQLVGTEVSGAGLEAAATSGYEAAMKILNSFIV